MTASNPSSRASVTGDSSLFAELVKPYERRVYATALALLRNDADAQDVAQEAILKAFANLRQFRGESRFSTWLIQITVNEARMRQRKQHAELFEPMVEAKDKDEEGAYTPRDFADWREIPSEALERSEIRALLAKALASLAQKYREVFLLRDVQHMSIEETAEGLEYLDRQRQDSPAQGAADAAGHSGARSGGWLVQPRAVREREQAMVVSCEQVWQEISNYLEGEVSPQLRAAMEAHFRECRRCTAVLDGTKNVVHLYADDRLVELPAGFSARWQRKLAESMPFPRGTGIRMADCRGRTGPGFGQLRARPLESIRIDSLAFLPR